jgi:hypothetical protein
MKWKGYRRKRSWPNLRYYSAVWRNQKEKQKKINPGIPDTKQILQPYSIK